MTTCVRTFAIIELGWRVFGTNFQNANMGLKAEVYSKHMKIVQCLYL